MLGFLKVAGRMFVFAGVAAPHMPARQTDPKMHPGIAHFQALLATLRAGLHGLNLIDVITFAH